MVGHPGQAGEHVAEVGEGILAVTLAGDDEGVDDRRALAGVRMTDEEPVLLADRGGPDGVFYSEIAIMPRCRW